MPITHDVLVAKRTLRAGEELRVTLTAFRGQCYMHLRRWYQREDGTWWPGNGKRQGGLSVRVCELPFLLYALRVTEQSALEEGLLFASDYADRGVPVPTHLRVLA